jgi:hypothetical protein
MVLPLLPLVVDEPPPLAVVLVLLPLLPHAATATTVAKTPSAATSERPRVRAILLMTSLLA